ncbi:MAG: TetR/AcrR family transcriptional regulator [Nocardioidaceae bacterium]
MGSTTQRAHTGTSGTPGASGTSGTTKGSATAERKRARERRILAATRDLFDARGLRDALIDDIARAVGINRAIIYRHFTSKEELFALTQVDYLHELGERLAAVDGSGGTPTQRLAALTRTFVEYGVEFPAFVDCAQTLMSRPIDELMQEVSEPAITRLGEAMTGCLSHLVSALDDGNGTGEFRVEDVDLLANTLYAQGLGGLALARVGTIIKESGGGTPDVTPISVEQVSDYLVRTALALASHT